MANAGWGLDPWGLGFYGGLLGPLSLQSAFTLSTRVVRVTTTVLPAAVLVTAVGDALNPLTWTIIRLDTGATFTIASIDQVTTTSFDITVVEAFGAASVTHEVMSTTLRKATGELIESPTTLLFPGLLASAVASPQDVLAQRKFVQRDIANPPTAPGLNSIGGTLVMTPGGDYQTVMGAALVKKLILRRLVTPQSGFFHLPDYGLGFAVKEPLTSSDLVLLRKEVLQQIELEPEIEKANASITLGSDGILSIKIRGRLKPTGESFEQSFKLPQSVSF